MTTAQKNVAIKLLQKHRSGANLSDKEKDLLIRYLKFEGISWDVLSEKCKGCSCG